MITQRKKREYPERIEQKKVVKFLWLMREYGHVLEYTATAQATFTGWGQINVNKQLGVQRGLPDLIVVLRPREEGGLNRLVFIEMKHPKASPSDVKPEQLSWLRNLNKVNSTVFAWTSYTGEDAVHKLTELLGDISCPKSDETFEEFLMK